MNTRITLASGVALALACLGGHASAAPSVGLYVVPGVFFDDAADAQRASSSKIDPSFRPALGDMKQTVALLQQRAQAHFKVLTPNIDSKNRLRSLALSVQVTRVSRYQIDKSDGTSDIYLPITLSVYFSNPMTGEVLQSFSQTRYDVLTVSGSQGRDEKEGRIRQAYLTGFAALLDSTLAAAARGFNPYVVETKVADTWRGFVILDRGYQAGIGKGDVMNDGESEIRVEHAGQHYAIAVPVLGTPKDGATFSRPGTMALSDVKKPRVLTIVSDGNPDLSDSVSTQLFTDTLGSGAPFATLPLNANFSQVQASIDGNTNIGHEVSGKRALPDYFIRIVTPSPRHYVLPTNLRYKTQHSYQAWAFAELLSRDGRVLYAADVSQRIDDTVTDGAGFNASDRREIVLKNALNELADRFGKEVRFKPLTLKVEAASAESFVVNDPGMSLHVGDTIRVYRNAGRPGRLSEDALVPIWEAGIAGRDGSKATATPILPLTGKAPKPDSGDVVLIESVGTAGAGGQRVAFCPAEKSQVGSVALARFSWLAYAGAASAPIVMVNPGLPDLVKGKVGGQSGFAKTLELRPVAYDRCLESLYRIDPTNRKCDDAMCAQSYNIRLAYRQKTQGKPAGQAILEHTFTASGYPVASDATQVSELETSDLEKDTRASLDDVMKQLLKPN